jgi:S1-C subfamily serine protease
MNGQREAFGPMAIRIQRLADRLYGKVRPENHVELQEFLAEIQDEEPAAIVQLLRRLDGIEIIDFDGRERIRLSAVGKTFYDQQCMPEVVLGLGYSDEKYSPAVVRLVLKKPDGVVVSGSGFFVDDPPSRIITNRHVLFRNEILQIENFNGEPISVGDLPKAFGPEDLDMAAIECVAPGNFVPLRIDWAPDSVRPLDEVLVLGYPYFGLHEPALHHAKGKIGSRPRRLAGVGQMVRDSLIISDAAAPGCSGGPVISTRGMVVGIIAGEVGAEGDAAGRQIFVSAIPSHYLREVFPR